MFNRLIKTTPLNLHEWLVCIIAALSIVIASEIHKLIIRRGAWQPESSPNAAAQGGT